jgi:hypothetical protein
MADPRKTFCSTIFILTICLFTPACNRAFMGDRLKPVVAAREQKATPLWTWVEKYVVTVPPRDWSIALCVLCLCILGYLLARGFLAGTLFSDPEGMSKDITAVNDCVASGQRG